MAIVNLQTSAGHSNAAWSLRDSMTEFEAGPEHWDATKAVQLANWENGGAKTPDTHGVAEDEHSASSLSIIGKGQAVQAATEIVDGPLRWKHTLPTTSLHVLQEWEGHVIDISKAQFTARLHDLTAGTLIDEEEANIPLSEVSRADATKMKVGSIFRWVIGYEIAADQPKKRISQIVFRDLPAVTQSDLKAGEAWAHRVIAALDR